MTILCDAFLPTLSYLSYALSLFLVSKLSWDYFFVYLYAAHVVNRNESGLRTSLKFTPGSWALVTGPTDGIGKYYALHLYRLGFNLVLVGRSPAKLADTKAWLLGADGPARDRELAVVVLDLANVGAGAIEKAIGPVLDGKDLRVVVNNAGLSYETAKPLLELDQLTGGGDHVVQTLVDVNVLGTVEVTRVCLKRMDMRTEAESGSKRGPHGGVIINLSSFSAVGATPCLTVYASTKAFIWHFGRCLSAEYEFRGLVVQTVIPYFVATKMTKIKKITWLHPNPDTYAKAALKMVGVQDITFGYLPHAILGLFVTLANYVAPTTMGRLTLKTVYRNRSAKKDS